MAITVDLMAQKHYPPLDARTPAELFELAMEIALALDDVQVLAPAGDHPGEIVVLDSRMLRAEGVRLF